MRTSTIVGILIGVFISAFIVSNFDEAEIKSVIEQTGLTGAVIAEEEYLEQFDYFVAKYTKSYAENGEYVNRYNIFKQNYKFIEDHNSNSAISGFSLGVNHMADLTNKEYRKQYLGYSNPKLDELLANSHSDEQEEFVAPNPFGLSATEEAIKNLQVPASVNWITKGAVGDIKNQGNCGSCYAFSAIAAIEGIYRINKKNTDNLSEQQVVDCSDGKYGNEGCKGGLMTNVFDYAHDNDLCVGEDYEYQAEHNSCKAWLKCGTDNYVSGHVEVEAQNRLKLYEAIAKQPVSVAVDAGEDTFRFYKSGIMASGCQENINHAVTAVGYGSNGWLFWRNNYVHIRNSWGTDWGMKGYMYLGSNKETGMGMCGLYLDSSYPTL
jgi:C1A family cysteine protease